MRLPTLYKKRLYHVKNACVLFLFTLLGFENTKAGDFTFIFKSNDLKTIQVNWNSFTPDTLTQIEDTLKVAFFYEIGDSAVLIQSGLDTILLFHSDEASNYISEGMSQQFIVGESDTSIFNKLMANEQLGFLLTDTTYLPNSFENLIPNVLTDSSVLLDSLINGYFITRDTIPLLDLEYNNIIVAFDTALFLIDIIGQTAYSLSKEIDTALALRMDIEGSGFTTFSIASDLTHGAIKVYFGDNPKEVNTGIFGITLEGNFLPGHLPENDVNGTGAYNPEAWQWLSDLKPASLRFPGGASGKFMHLLPYDSDGDNINDVFPKGYGYDIDEIIKFYDLTDHFEHVGGCFSCTYSYAQVKADLEDGDSGGSSSIWEICTDFIDSKYDSDLKSFYDKWKKQQSLPESEPLYIDQFINLIYEIEEENNYKIDVILDLNILSESAAQCAKIVNYLRTDNLVTDVNVVGVEMGNECYFKWLNDLMWIVGFDEYWSFLNGGVPDVSPAVPDWVLSNHNFLTTFRTGTFSTNPIKIGIPASDPGEADDDGVITPSSWNIELKERIIDYTENDKFDAVIIHNYFDAQNHWQNIVQNSMCLKYPNNGFGTCNPENCATTTFPTKWDYTVYDDRLQLAFDGFLGLTTPYTAGSVRDYIKTEYKNDYDQLKEELSIGTIPITLINYGIEIWNSEKNLKEKLYLDPATPITGTVKTQMENLNEIYDNSFPHGLLMLEWFLNDIKSNYVRANGHDFLTYSHFHNFAGGSNTDLLTIADYGDFVNFKNEEGFPSPINEEDYTDVNYYMRRTSYWTMFLLSEIVKNNLEYLPSNMEMAATNANIAPTVFIKDKNYLYIYYSNMRKTPSKLKLYPNNLGNLYNGNRLLEGFTGEGLHAVIVDMNYMSSGTNSLFISDNAASVNDCYSSNPTDTHPFDIFGITESTLDMVDNTATVGDYTVTVPANSYGYFKIKLNWSSVLILKHEGTLPSPEIVLYPDPTNTYISISDKNNSILFDELLHFKVISSLGVIVLEGNTLLNTDIDINNLQSGVYFLSLQYSNSPVSNIQFVKL